MEILLRNHLCLKMTLFNFQIRGTKLRPIFLFLSTIVQDKVTVLHLSKDEIRCSEMSSNKRMLFNYVLYAKNLVNYTYEYDEPIKKIRFELKWLLERIQEVKIKNRIQFTITKEEPDFLELTIFGFSKTKKDKKIKLSIAPEINLQEPPADLYYDHPITLHKEDFLPFLKIKPSVKNGKVIKEEVEIKIQAPNFLKFTRILDNSETLKYGIFKKDCSIYKEKFFINELKHLIKLQPSTVVFNIYQPKKTKVPMCIGGLCGEYGEWKVYIHCCDVKPVTEELVD